MIFTSYTFLVSTALYSYAAENIIRLDLTGIEPLDEKLNYLTLCTYEYNAMSG